MKIVWLIVGILLLGGAGAGVYLVIDEGENVRHAQQDVNEWTTKLEAAKKRADDGAAIADDREVMMAKRQAEAALGQVQEARRYLDKYRGQRTTWWIVVAVGALGGLGAIAGSLRGRRRARTATPAVAGV
jgi:hypothetical protein